MAAHHTIASHALKQSIKAVGRKEEFPSSFDCVPQIGFRATQTSAVGPDNYLSATGETVPRNDAHLPSSEPHLRGRRFVCFAAFSSAALVEAVVP
jgi:hypothetical protein